MNVPSEAGRDATGFKVHPDLREGDEVSNSKREKGHRTGTMF